MEQNFQRLGVSGQDDELGNTTIESLGRFSAELEVNILFLIHRTSVRTFVGTLLQLLVLARLLNEFQDLKDARP